MVWDCIAENPNGTAPSWFGEALGEGFFRYEEGGRFVVRRIPVEADCEFLYAEGFTQERAGKSSYACFALSGIQAAPIVILLAAKN